MTKEEKNILYHTLGFNFSRKPFKSNFPPYRNFFDVGKNITNNTSYDILHNLEEKGLVDMEKHEWGNYVFYCTEKGIEETTKEFLFDYYINGVKRN